MKMRTLKAILFTFLLTFFLSCSYAEEPVTLTLWEFSAGESLMRNLIDKFQKENPDIKVNLQQLTWEYGLDKFVMSLAAGNAPDVCELGTTWISKFASSGILLDITENVKDVKEKYFLWDFASYDNRVYGIPWLAGTRVVFYNKDLFIKAGLDPERPPQTWQELLDAAKKIHDPKKGIWGFSVCAGEPESPWQEFLPFAWSNGARVLSPDLKKSALDSPQMVEALKFYQSISRYSLIERQSQINELFAEGKIGIQISGSWNMRLISRINPGLRFGLSFIPRSSEGGPEGIAFSGGELFVITKNSRHPREALELIRFLTARENVMEVVSIQQNVIPAQRETIDEPYYKQYPEQKIFLSQLENALGPPNHPKWTDIRKLSRP
ncbi:MAG: extracellular solute-binding protein [Candidatus Omnitrophica bacterium]|nr:extracellular solute-binding protein [Candidatus Omnitrophota bacterium]